MDRWPPGACRVVVCRACRSLRGFRGEGGGVAGGRNAHLDWAKVRAKARHARRPRQHQWSLREKSTLACPYSGMGTGAGSTGDAAEDRHRVLVRGEERIVGCTDERVVTSMSLQVAAHYAQFLLSLSVSSSSTCSGPPMPRTPLPPASCRHRRRRLQRHPPHTGPSTSATRRFHSHSYGPWFDSLTGVWFWGAWGALVRGMRCVMRGVWCWCWGASVAICGHGCDRRFAYPAAYSLHLVTLTFMQVHSTIISVADIGLRTAVPPFPFLWKVRTVVHRPRRMRPPCAFRCLCARFYAAEAPTPALGHRV